MRLDWWLRLKIGKIPQGLVEKYLRTGKIKLNRTSEHRKALLKNMLNSLIKYEQIKTTLPKAKFLKPQADKIITLG